MLSRSVLRLGVPLTTRLSPVARQAGDRMASDGAGSSSGDPARPAQTTNHQQNEQQRLSPITRPINASTSSSSTKAGGGTRNKGKGRAMASPGSSPLGEAATSLSSMLDEALSSQLDLNIAPPDDRCEHFIAPPPLARPPRAHYGDSTAVGLRPRLMSQLSGSASPTASLTFETAESSRPHERQRYVSSPDAGESSSSFMHRQSWDWSAAQQPTNNGEAYPDLDPATGLPKSPSRESIDLEEGGASPTKSASKHHNSQLHVQRTISQLSSGEGEAAAEQGMSLPFIGQLPPVPSLPGLPTLDFAGLPPAFDKAGSRRPYSTSASSSMSWTPKWLGPSKRHIDSMLSEDDQAPTKEEEHLKHNIKYKTPQYPIVLCHGLLGFDYIGPASMPTLQISHWRGIREVLEKNGCEVLIARVPATGSIKDRAEVLNDTISKTYPGRTINLIAHSMGGLDCRYLISQVQPKAFNIASLTTISTPHRGSPFADFVIDNVIGRDRLPQLLSVLESLNLPNSGDGSAFSALGTRAMREFNMEVIDSEDVKYFSWGASFKPGLMDTFRWPHSVILAKEGPNDGLVSVFSAKWGEYRGTLIDVNHLDLVGWVNQMKYMLNSLTGKTIKFKPATFYLEISDFLAEQGF